MGKRISWKVKKHLAQILSVGILSATVMSSAYSETVDTVADLKIQENIEAEESVKEMAGSSAYLQLDYSEVEKADSDTQETSEVSRGSETASVKKESTDTDIIQVSESILPVKDADVKKGAVSETDSIGKEDAVSSKLGRNVVVSNADKDTPNVVRNLTAATTEAPLFVSKTIENHGEAPKEKECENFYQYPVEIGYAFDENYDRKQNAKDILLNEIFDTIPVEEESITEDTAGEVEAAQQDLEETTQQIEDITRETTNSGATSTQQDVESKDSMQKETEIQTSGTIAGNGAIVWSSLNEIQQNVWKKIMPTTPVQINQTEQMIEDVQSDVAVTREDGKESEGNSTKTNHETSDVDESANYENNQPVDGNTSDTDAESEEEIEDTVLAEENDITPEEEEIKADAGYYIVSGSMREGCDAFVSDITICPTGKNGFNKVRVGEEGEFQDKVILTEDAADKEVILYFTDGEQVTTGTIYTYSKDLTAPVCSLPTEAYYELESGKDVIYCTSETDLPVETDDGANGGTGIQQICYVYADQLHYIIDGLEEAALRMPENFFGRVLTNCTDKAGNVSAIDSRFFLVDSIQPEITISEDEVCTAPYALWVDVYDSGNITSGIQSVECMVNGEIYEIKDMDIEETVRLGTELEVPTKERFCVALQEEGSYEIEIKVTDNAGNVTIQTQNIEVTKPELVSVYMPGHFTIHIDPQQLKEREQIYSDNITLTNVSEFDVRVKIDSIKLTVNDEVTEDGVEKDCNIYLVAPDTGEKIKLEKGLNEDVYSYVLPQENMDSIENMYFIGDISENSDALWKGEDIRIDIKLSFEKAKEIVEE